MNEPILCLVILLFLGWVLYLRLKIEQAKRTQEKAAPAEKPAPRGDVTKGMRKFSAD